MVSAAKRILHIADYRVEPLEHLAVIIPAFSMSDDYLMAAVSLSNSGKAVQTVADDLASGANVSDAPGMDLLFRIARALNVRPGELINALEEEARK